MLNDLGNSAFAGVLCLIFLRRLRRDINDHGKYVHLCSYLETGHCTEPVSSYIGSAAAGFSSAGDVLWLCSPKSVTGLTVTVVGDHRT